MGIGLGPVTPVVPAITASSISGTAEDGQVLTASYSATGSPSPIATYQWQVNGTNITGETAQTIALDEAGMSLSDGDTISCEITATNSEGSDTAEPTIAYVYVAPPDVTAPTITSADPSGTKTQGATVSGTLTADETVTWSKSGTDAAKLTLDTSTGAWSLDTSALGSLAITVTATDGSGNASSQSWTFTISASGYAYTAPVVALASDYAVNGPLYVDLTFPNGTDTAGLYLYEQVASDDAFTTPLSGEGAIRTSRQRVDLTWFADADGDGLNDMPVRTVLENQPNGTTKYRCWLEEEAADGLSFAQVSDISNTVTAVVSVETPSTLDPAKIVGTQQTLSNGNLTVTATSATSNGSMYAAPATNGRSGLRFFAALVEAEVGGAYGIGLAAPTFDFTKKQDDATNIDKRIFWRRASTVYLPDGSSTTLTGATTAAGARMYAAYDTVLNKAWFGTSAGGWLNGDPQAGTGGYDLPSNTGTLLAFLVTQRSSGGQVSITFEPTTAGALPKPARMSHYV